MITKDKEYLTIVIADDDADDREFVVKALLKAEIEHKLVEVLDGEQLINLLENRGKNAITEKEPDLVFLDLNMPKVDGFKALQQIKSSLSLKDIPIYILSTSGEKFHIEKALDLGASGYYRKSARFDDIVTMVNEVCRQHHKS